MQRFWDLIAKMELLVKWFRIERLEDCLSRKTNYTNIIEYITIASEGNAIDFGDLSAGNSTGVDSFNS